MIALQLPKQTKTGIPISQLFRKRQMSSWNDVPNFLKVGFLEFGQLQLHPAKVARIHLDTPCNSWTGENCLEGMVMRLRNMGRYKMDVHFFDWLMIGWLCWFLYIFARLPYFGDVHMDQTMKLNAWVLQWWVGFSGVFRSLFLAVSIDGFLIAVVVCQVHWMFELLLSAHVGLLFFSEPRCQVVKGVSWMSLRPGPLAPLGFISRNL